MFRTELKHTRVELRTHSHLPDHPFVVRFLASFQTNTRIFLLTEFLPGGELFSLLSERGKMKEATARFYLAELVLAVEFLHDNGVIYRLALTKLLVLTIF